jgi:hypothetical protein
MYLLTSKYSGTQLADWQRGSLKYLELKAKWSRSADSVAIIVLKKDQNCPNITQK